MTTQLKLELLNDAIDTNGIGLNLPADAIGIMGGNMDAGVKVIRNGQELAVKPGEVLLKGDIIRTGSMAQTIFLSSTQAVAMTKVALAPNYQVTLDTSTELALEGEVIEVSVTEAMNPELLASADDTSGLFGALGAATIAGVPAAGVAAGGVALAALGGGSGGGSDSADSSNNTSSPDTTNGDTNPGDPAPTPSGGPFSSGGAQIDSGLAATPLGGNLPFSFADGGAQLESALPVSPASSGDSPLAMPVSLISAGIEQIASSAIDAVRAAAPAQAADAIDTLVSAPAALSSMALPEPLTGVIAPVAALM